MISARAPPKPTDVLAFAAEVNRYYSNAYGRFMTPDPYTNSGRLNDPQSWDRYAYTRGDPVNRLDPGGSDDCAPGDTLPCSTTVTGGYDDYWDYSASINPGTYMSCMADPGCYASHMSGAGVGGGGAEIDTDGGTAPTSVKNVTAFSSNPYASLAAALNNSSDCSKWLSNAFSTSAYAGSFQNLNQFLTSSTGISSVTASADFVGGTANGVYSNTLAPDYLILINSAGAYYNALPQNTTIGFTNNYKLQFSNIQGGTAEAQAFILLHELAHAMNIFQPDATGTPGQDNAAQAANNDLMWYHCGSVIQSFSH